MGGGREVKLKRKADGFHFKATETEAKKLIAGYPGEYERVARRKPIVHRGVGLARRSSLLAMSRSVRPAGDRCNGHNKAPR